MHTVRSLAEIVGGEVLGDGADPGNATVGAAAAVHRRFREFREQGGTVLLISTELEEILEYCDRVAVLYRGHLSAPMPARGMGMDPSMGTTGTPHSCASRPSSPPANIWKILPNASEAPTASPSSRYARRLW